MGSLALKWSFFFLGSGLVVFNEYSALFMQQLGLSLAQISCTSLMGVLHLTLPLFGFLGGSFRARKLILSVLLPVLFITTLAPLLHLSSRCRRVLQNRVSPQRMELACLERNSFQETSISTVISLSMDHPKLSYFEETKN